MTPISHFGTALVVAGRRLRASALALTAVAASWSCLAGAQHAFADGPTMYNGPAPVVVPGWSGCYVGAGGGYGLFDQDTSVAGALSNSNGGRGWFGTAQLGCDYQLNAAFVIGAFADYDFASSLKGDMSIPSLAWVGEEKIKSAWSVGGRVGWVPFPQLMVFTSVGYTEARFDQVDFFSSPGVATGTSLAKHTATGWFVGTGYEYRFGFHPKLTWKTEYRLSDFGSDNLPVIATATGVPTGTIVGSHPFVQTIRSELVWRF